jgi:hypothetical protein
MFGLPLRQTQEFEEEVLVFRNPKTNTKLLCHSGKRLGPKFRKNIISQPGSIPRVY